MTDGKVRIAPGSLILPVGSTGAGKSTYVAKLIDAGGLPATAVISSDQLRGVLTDDPEDQSSTPVVFDLIRKIVAERLLRGNTTWVDATNVLQRDRASLTELARQIGAPVVYIRFDVERDVLLEHNARRDNPRPIKVIDKHIARLGSDCQVGQLKKEADLVLDHDGEAPTLLPSGHDGGHLAPPFVFIGDVHGQADALDRLLARIDRVRPDALKIFVGDIGHKGPESVAAYRRVLDLVETGDALVVASNHGKADADKLGRHIDRGETIGAIASKLRDQVDSNPGQFMTRMVAGFAEQLAAQHDGDALTRQVVKHNRSVPTLLRLAGGTIVVCHGGMTPEIANATVTGPGAQTVCLYGTPTGKDPDTGYPTGRDSWTEPYRQARATDPNLPFVIYGHVIYPDHTPKITGSTAGIDLGAADGEAIGALIVDEPPTPGGPLPIADTLIETV